MSTDTGPTLLDLPNGFHDAELAQLEIDLEHAEIRFVFRFWVGDVDALDKNTREMRRSGVLHLRGVMSAEIEPPRAGYQFSTGTGVVVDGDLGVYPGDGEPPDDGLVRMWFYVSTWNAKMRFVSRTLELSWTQ